MQKNNNDIKHLYPISARLAKPMSELSLIYFDYVNNGSLPNLQTISNLEKSIDLLIEALNTSETGEITPQSAKRELNIFYTIVYIIKDLRDILMADSTTQHLKKQKNEIVIKFYSALGIIDELIQTIELYSTDIEKNENKEHDDDLSKPFNSISLC